MSKKKAIKAFSVRKIVRSCSADERSKNKKKEKRARMQPKKERREKIYIKRFAFKFECKTKTIRLLNECVCASDIKRV